MRRKAIRRESLLPENSDGGCSGGSSLHKWSYHDDVGSFIKTVAKPLSLQEFLNVLEGFRLRATVERTGQTGWPVVVRYLHIFFGLR